ncbi:hypothetical protein KFE25_005857 [Diacronema lutheri]|uniref:ethanolamine-phosphate cytidylyltransferase n=3 Tax=Diacronema lutheri TaxID=2081491 RepID=A0A8J6CC13_DIALT|nr:hypothetical protein KFE25_005857 [Diacronema lutheri]
MAVRLAAVAAAAALLALVARRVRGARRGALRRARERAPPRAVAEVRVWMDGVFDLMHFGHANAFRLGRAQGTYLVVGVNDDESVTRLKGAPLMSEDERAAAVAGCRWVDEVVRRVPYVMDDAYVRALLDEHKIDFILHGDDPCIVDGRDVYEVAIRLGKYRTVPRTEGISTTDVLRRMLSAGAHQGERRSAPEPPSAASHFLLTARMLADFAPAARAPRDEPRCVVYLDGAFDLLHAGHVAAMRAARALGDFLIVGVHDDATVRRVCPAAQPVLTLNERVMGVLGCRHVDDVLISPPWLLSREMIASLAIAVVVRARVDDEAEACEQSICERYETARTLDIYAELRCDEFAQLRASQLVRRACERESQLSSRVARKAEAERDYYRARYGLDMDARPSASAAKGKEGEGL